MGGSDPDNFTTVVIDALRLVRVEGLEAIVVLGGCIVRSVFGAER